MPGKLINRCAVLCLLWLPLQLQASENDLHPTAAITPAPDAFTFVAVKYPPVPIAGTEWAKTQKKREAEQRCLKAGKKQCGKVQHRVQKKKPLRSPEPYRLRLPVVRCEGYCPSVAESQAGP